MIASTIMRSTLEYLQQTLKAEKGLTGYFFILLFSSIDFFKINFIKSKRKLQERYLSVNHYGSRSTSTKCFGTCRFKRCLIFSNLMTSELEIPMFFYLVFQSLDHYKVSASKG